MPSLKTEQNCCWPSWVLRAPGTSSYHLVPKHLRARPTFNMLPGWAIARPDLHFAHPGNVDRPTQTRGYFCIMNHNRKNNENLILENSKYIVWLLPTLIRGQLWLPLFAKKKGGIGNLSCNCTVQDLSSKNSSGTKLLFKLIT